MRLIVLMLTLVVGLGFAGGARAETPDAAFAAGKAAYDAGDHAAALARWRPLAEAGHPMAQYWLGQLHRRGHGVDRDYGRAITWYSRAARQTRDGDALRRAAYALGYMVDHGEGVAKDPEKAECLYRVSAENGYVEGQWSLSIVLREQAGINDGVVEWVWRAAKQGYPRALARKGTLGLINPYSDHAEDYMFLIWASKLGSQRAAKQLEAVRQQGSPNELALLAAGEKMAERWQPRPEAIPEPPKAVPVGCMP